MMTPWLSPDDDSLVESSQEVETQLASTSQGGQESTPEDDKLPDLIQTSANQEGDDHQGDDSLLDSSQENDEASEDDLSEESQESDEASWECG